MGGYSIRTEPQQSQETVFATLTHQGGVLKVRFKGPGIGEREATVLSAEIGDAIASLGRRLSVLVLDLRDVRTMSSIGLGMCIQLRNQAKDHRARSVMLGVNPQLADLIRMLKVNRLYTMVDDEDDLARWLAA